MSPDLNPNHSLIWVQEKQRERESQVLSISQQGEVKEKWLRDNSSLKY